MLPNIKILVFLWPDLVFTLIQSSDYTSKQVFSPFSITLSLVDQILLR